jgi:hypothetical protein
MHIDFPACQYFGLDVLNTLRNHLDGGWMKIGGREPELFNAVLFVQLLLPLEFLTHVDDSSDPMFFRENSNIPPKWPSPQKNGIVYEIPPVPNLEDTT